MSSILYAECSAKEHGGLAVSCLLSGLSGVPAHLQHIEHCLLCRRILMLSNDSSRVSAAVHAAAALLYPFRWHHIYLPLLPHCLQASPCPQLPRTAGTQQVQWINDPAAAPASRLPAAASASASASRVLQQSALLRPPHRERSNPPDTTIPGAPQGCSIRRPARSFLLSCGAAGLCWPLREDTASHTDHHTLL